MSKKGLYLPSLLLIVLLLVISVAYADSVELKLNEEKEVSGVKIIFTALSQDDGAMLKFNGKTVFLTKGDEQKISGMVITLDQTLETKDETKVWITITIPFDCGNGQCEEGEKPYCCKDCGCTKNYECFENMCIKNGTNECIEDDDCSKKSCQEVTCEGVPRKCVYHPITECKNKDGCCLDICTSYADDNDCVNKKECTTQEQCDDKDPTTKDSCSIPDAKCYHIKEKPKKVTTQNATTVSVENTPLTNGTMLSSNITNQSMNVSGVSLSGVFNGTNIFIIIIILLLIIVAILIIFLIKRNKTNNNIVIKGVVDIPLHTTPSAPLQSINPAEPMQQPVVKPIQPAVVQPVKQPVITKPIEQFHTEFQTIPQPVKPKNSEKLKMDKKLEKKTVDKKAVVKKH